VKYLIRDNRPLEKELDKIPPEYQAEILPISPGCSALCLTVRYDVLSNSVKNKSGQFIIAISLRCTILHFCSYHHCLLIKDPSFHIPVYQLLTLYDVSQPKYCAQFFFVSCFPCVCNICLHSVVTLLVNGRSHEGPRYETVFYILLDYVPCDQTL
jgi:hypothetical protein